MRMTTAQPRTAARRPVNLSLDASLVAEARSFGIPLSQTLEAALRERVKAEREARWLEENREAIAEYNARVAAEGPFVDEFGNL